MAKFRTNGCCENIADDHGSLLFRFWMHRQQGQMPVSWGLFPPDQPCTRFLCIQEMEEQKDPRVTYLRISGGLAKASWRSAGAPSLSQLSTTTTPRPYTNLQQHCYDYHLGFALRCHQEILSWCSPSYSSSLHSITTIVELLLFYHHLCKHGISLWLALCWIDSVAHVCSRMLLWNIPDAPLVT